jgi:hypothetical protein
MIFVRLGAREAKELMCLFSTIIKGEKKREGGGRSQDARIANNLRLGYCLRVRLSHCFLGVGQSGVIASDHMGCTGSGTLLEPETSELIIVLILPK